MTSQDKVAGGISDLALVVPVYNFENHISLTFNKIKDWRARHSNLSIKVIFVDDGSKDQTVQILEKLKTGCDEWCEILACQKNAGKGAAVRAGVQVAYRFQSKTIFFTDCDLHYGLDIIVERLVQELDHSDIVIVDRSWTMHSHHHHFLRKLATSIFKRVVSILTGVNYLDTQAGLKGFRAAQCKPIFEVLTLNGFSFDVELLSVALYFRFQIKQVPVEFDRSHSFPNYSSVQLLSHSLAMIGEVIKINLNWKNGRYLSEGLLKPVNETIYRVNPKL